MGEEHGMNCAVFFFTNQTKRVALGDVSSPRDTRRAHSCANRHPSETRNKRCRFGEKIPFRISNCRPLPVVKSLHEDIKAHTGKRQEEAETGGGGGGGRKEKRLTRT